MFPSIESAWNQARGLRFPCWRQEDLKRCTLCGWPFTPFDDWQDRVGMFDEAAGVYEICKHHPELGETAWDCLRAIEVPMLPTRSRLRILAHEAAYWLRVVACFIWILVKWWAQLLCVRIFHPVKYRRYQAFMRGELFKETD